MDGVISSNSNTNSNSIPPTPHGQNQSHSIPPTPDTASKAQSHWAKLTSTMKPAPDFAAATPVSSLACNDNSSPSPVSNGACVRHMWENVG